MGASGRLEAGAVAAALAAVVCALALESGGYFPHAWVWSSVLLLWVAALALVTRPIVASWELVLFAAAAAVLTAWTLLSAAWSSVPSQSLLDARRDVVYVAGALATLAAVGRLCAALVPVAILAATTVTAVVGLARYLVSGPADVAEATLLSWPVGYANGFAALAAMSIPIAVSLAAQGRRDALRVAASASTPVLVGVLLLTSSRGGLLAAAAGIGALAALDRRRRTLGLVGIRLSPAVVVIVAACAGADLTGVTAAPASRRAVVGAAFVASAAAAAFAVRRVPRADRGRELPRSAAAAIACLAVALGAVASALPGSGAEEAARRLVAAERAAYWKFAWRLVADHPLLGSGAGSFGHAWFQHGPIAVYGGALDAHNVYLETLAELGPVGLILLLVLLVLPVTQMRRAARASRLGAAVAAAYVAFLVHALVDWDWELPAVALAGLLLGGSVLVLAARGHTRPFGGRARVALAAAAVALAVAALFGLRSSALPGAAAAEHSERNRPPAASTSMHVPFVKESG